MSNPKSAFNIAVSRNGKEKVMVAVGEQETVSAMEVDTAEGMKQQFVYNVLGGHVDKVIVDAHKYAGKDKAKNLPAILPHYGKDQLDALRKCLDSTPTILRRVWAKKIKTSERVRLVSLSGLRAALKTKGAREPAVVTKKTFLAACEGVEQDTWNREDMVKLYDMFTDASPEEK